MDRLELLENWLKPQLPSASYTLAPASADASFRRYFRVSLPDRSLIVMDAPPELEDCRPFIHVAELLREAGVRVPHILAQDLQQGFLLLTDLGSTTYLDALNQDEVAADTLYAAAAGALINIQLASRPAVLPDYDEALLLREMRLFPDWYVSKHLQIELTRSQAETLDGAFTQILHNNLSQPKVFVHRDYHSRNLMVDGDEPGILDFQDAVYGPITYDLVSLFKDAYIHWEEERVLDWTIRYWEKAKKAGLPVSRDFAEFYRDFEWMGVQRHIKVLGIFARLCHRDGKENYLKDMPLVMAYLRKVCERYRELGPLLKLLDELENRQAVVGYTF
ncbi:MAG: phosphotransferase [Gammaproteobacteria bacterium]|nr:phosphotransferase [Gammaproteobacteria bacterium]MBU1980130.1 phosphotransferase [Gammaproteobacteria bacterium]